MNSVIFACFLCLFTASFGVPAIIEHNGDSNVSTLKFCNNPKRCEPYPYTRCVESSIDNEIGFSCLCEDRSYIELFGFSYNDPNHHFKLQNCRVKQGMCDDPDFACADTVNATCFFEVARNQSGALNGYSFCRCEQSNLTLADRSHMCYQTCHGECVHSDTCALGPAGKDGKPVPVCRCKDGYTGAKCDKKIENKKEEAKSNTGYIVAIVILSIVSVIALAGVGFLFWKSRQ